VLVRIAEACRPEELLGLLLEPSYRAAEDVIREGVALLDSLRQEGDRVEGAGDNRAEIKEVSQPH
jgi:hypothetical protein